MWILILTAKLETYQVVDVVACVFCHFRRNVVTLTSILSIYLSVFEVFLARVCKEIIQRAQGDLGAKDSQNKTPAHICASATLVAVISKPDTSPLVQNSTDKWWSWAVVILLEFPNAFVLQNCSIPPSLVVMSKAAGTWRAGASYFKLIVRRRSVDDPCAWQLDTICNIPCDNTQERYGKGKVRPEGLKFLYHHAKESFEQRDFMNHTPAEVAQEEQLG